MIHRWAVLTTLTAALALSGGCKKAGFRANAFNSTLMHPAMMAEKGSTAMASRTATPTALEPDALSETAVKRFMIYFATLHLTVPDVATAIHSIRELAEGQGGHMQEMSKSSIKIKVPAKTFTEAIERIETFGDVVDRNIQGTDVTEHMLDLDIRLENLLETRKRLIALMDKGGDVEDLLAVEKELNRVTEQLERIKGKIRHLQDQIALSTITVHLNSPLPQEKFQELIPFPWVKELGREVRQVGRAGFSPDRKWRTWLKFDPPEGFIRAVNNEGFTRLVSGDGAFMLIQRRDNFEDATSDFWKNVVRRWLAAGRTIAISDESEVRTKSGLPMTLLTGSQRISNEAFTYKLALGTSKKYVYTVEVWGKEAVVQQHDEAITKLLKSLPLKPTP